MNIDSVVKQRESVALSGSDIKTFLDNQVEVMRYADLMDFENIDDVLGRSGAVILLYQTERDFGHYTALFRSEKDRKVLIFYDSLGIGMDNELKFSRFNQRNMGGRIVKHLTRLTEAGNYKVISNRDRLQKSLTDNNTCGRYAMLRIKFKHMSNQRFNHFLKSNNGYDADYAVTILTMDIPNIIQDLALK